MKLDSLARRLLVGTFRDEGERGMRPTHVPFLLFFWLFQTLCYLVGQCKKLYFLDIDGSFNDDLRCKLFFRCSMSIRLLVR